MEFRIKVPYELEDGTPQPFDVVFTSAETGTCIPPEPKSKVDADVKNDK